ncbi:hypothetical protein ACFQZX_09490 [Mucilaginibacter litoreus]|uniref:Lipocalin-like domain-containing protein n=1 Tax=Mucilaginibacter litoreus TaxID=1048221 RepID=A0ABW3ATQ7_9SPHI
MKKAFPLILVLALLCSFKIGESLSGRWIYSGGIYNGKPEPAPKDYTLQRQYDAEHYAALLIEKDTPPVTYEAGNYKLLQDSCFETQTFSAQPSNLINVTVKYHYQIKNDTLTFEGILPNGTKVQEYWKKADK